MLYSHEQRKLFESQDVKFEEVEGREQVTVDLDSKDEVVDDGSGDPRGARLTRRPSTTMMKVPLMPPAHHLRWRITRKSIGPYPAP